MARRGVYVVACGWKADGLWRHRIVRTALISATPRLPSPSAGLHGLSVLILLSSELADTVENFLNEVFLHEFCVVRVVGPQCSPPRQSVGGAGGRKCRSPERGAISSPPDAYLGWVGGKGGWGEGPGHRGHQLSGVRPGYKGEHTRSACGTDRPIQLLFRRYTYAKRPKGRKVNANVFYAEEPIHGVHMKILFRPREENGSRSPCVLGRREGMAEDERDEEGVGRKGGERET